MEIVVPHPYHGAHDGMESTDDENLDDEEEGDEDVDEEDDDQHEMMWDNGEENDDQDEADDLVQGEIANDEEDDDGEDGEVDEGANAADDFGPIDDDDDSEDEDDDDDGDIDMGEQDYDLPIDGDGNWDIVGGNVGDRRRLRRGPFNLDIGREIGHEIRWTGPPLGSARRHVAPAEWLSNRSPHDTIDTHPLLSDSQETPGAQRLSASGGSRGRSNQNSQIRTATTDLETLTELLGPAAAPLIQAVRGGRPSDIHIDMSNVPFGQGLVNIGGLGGLGNFGALLANTFNIGVNNTISRQSSSQLIDDQDSIQTGPQELLDNSITNILNEAPMTSGERWIQEARLFYDRYAEIYSVRTMNSILAILLPKAIEQKKKEDQLAAEKKAKELEEERKRKEEEAKTKAKAEAAAKAEAERLAAEAAAAAAATSGSGAATSDVIMAEAGENNVDGQAPEPMETENATVPSELTRIMVEIRGRQVDITGMSNY
jgi:hypothetical protein